jgi:hypothetical protein
LRSRRLETLLGTRIDDVTYAQVTNLVTNQVAEAFDLDSEEQLYSRADSDKRKLATAVAALANTAGGLVVIEEDDQARAAGGTTVTLSDGEVGRMRQIVAPLNAPLPGRSTVASTRTAVVLPAPFGPNSPNTVPRSTSKSTPSRAVTSPKRLRKSCTTIAFSIIALPSRRRSRFDRATGPRGHCVVDGTPEGLGKCGPHDNEPAASS